MNKHLASKINLLNLLVSLLFLVALSLVTQILVQTILRMAEETLS
jgi:hypothetical protein